MITLIAFAILGLVAIAACETTRGYLKRLSQEEHSVNRTAMDAVPATPRSVT